MYSLTSSRLFHVNKVESLAGPISFYTGDLFKNESFGIDRLYCSVQILVDIRNVCQVHVLLLL